MAKQKMKRMTVSKYEELTKKAWYYDAVLSSGTTYTTAEVAACLDKTAVWLNKELEDRKVIKKVNDIWVLTAKYQGKGLTENRTMLYSGKENEISTRVVYAWTEKGREFICELLLKGIDDDETS